MKPDQGANLGMEVEVVAATQVQDYQCTTTQFTTEAGHGNICELLWNLGSLNHQTIVQHVVEEAWNWRNEEGHCDEVTAEDE